MFWRLGGGRDHGAGRLMSYIARGDHELRDRRGEEMTQREQQRFIERSEEYSHEKQMILSPERGDELSDREMSLYARRSLREFTRDRPSVNYCYAIHRDTEHPHIQAALTGTREDLYADLEERKRQRRQSREHFREPQRERRRELERDRQRRREREQQRQQERDREPEREQERERDRSRGRGW